MIIDLNTPIWQLTAGELIEFIKKASESPKEVAVVSTYEERYVYGYKGLAKLFGCSEKTAGSILASGEIDKAVSQVGRQIVIDAPLALQLTKRKNVKIQTKQHTTQRR